MNLLNSITSKIAFHKERHKFKNISKKKKTIIIVLLAIIIVFLFFIIFKGGNKKNIAEQTYIEVQAEVGDITETIEQSGVVEPYERYEITSLVKGEIVSSPFEEGDFVNEGDTLYQIDDEDAQLTIEKSQNNVEKAKIALNETYKNVSDLNIYAPSSGKLSDFSLKVGDKVNGGIIGTIHNTDKLTIDVPFSPSDYNRISVGDGVTATSALYMTSLSGKVTHKYSANSGSGTDGSVAKNIEIEIQNPGALADGTSFAATVHTSSGDVNSAGSGVIDGGTTSSVTAEVSGDVSYVAVKEGDYVKKGQLIAILENINLRNSQRNNELNLKDSQLSLKSSQKTLENYNITAPISGTIITKTSKAGDKIDNSNSATVMMVVADMSKMKFTITVDELDIASIKIGQTAMVDADALPDTVFEAKVTSIASEGVSSGDGVTTFTVELTIDEPGELKSGMNVNANILINEVHNVVYIPEDALIGVKGNNASVLVKSDNKKSDSKKDNTKTDTQIQEKTDDKAQGEEHKMNEDMQKMPQGENNGENNSENHSENRNIPDGYEIRQVVIGISDGTNIEIVSGLEEDETVAYIPTTASSDNPFTAMMSQMHGGGGMPTGGGMPSGGGAGRPSGGGMPGGR